MDPNACLDEIRRILAERDRDDVSFPLEGRAARLAELCDAMDQWLSRGGFLPQAWERK